jgi:DNA-binding transcriptional LysR family regulator
MERPTTITARRGPLMLDWDNLRFFLTISRHGSLSAAAMDLHVAQSTVGRRLASLEASLGGRLLNRTPEGYVPTLAGRAPTTVSTSVD